MTSRQPTCYIIAGPNGAGKTTFALRYLPEMTGCRNFINADLIADGLSPLDPSKVQLEAGKILLSEIQLNVAQRVESGGHDIPDEAIERRYRRTILNFLHTFSPMCHEVLCYDNSSLKPILVFEERSGARVINDKSRYETILRCIDE
jgi:predicted ABC-type ATPase